MTWTTRAPLLLLLLLLPQAALSKPKEKVFPANCDRVWAAVKQAAATSHYNFASLDDAQKKGLISTGNNWTGKRYLDIALSGSGDTCTVAIGGQFSGLTHNDKGDLFQRIADALAKPEPPAPTPPPAKPAEKP